MFSGDFVPVMDGRDTPLCCVLRQHFERLNGCEALESACADSLLISR